MPMEKVRHHPRRQHPPTLLDPSGFGDHLVHQLCGEHPAGLCAELTDTETIYPGTDLVLVYSVKGF